MRGHRQTPPKSQIEFTVSGDGLVGATVYRQNGKWYYECGKCKVHGGGIDKFSRFMQTVNAHGLKCAP